MKNSKRQRLYLLSFGLVIISVVLIISQYVFSADIRYDRQTIEDLQEIENELHQVDDVVDSLDELELSEGLTDRAKQRNYSIEHIESKGEFQIYKICAEFRTDTKDDSRISLDFSNHADGQDCFERQILNQGMLRNTIEPDPLAN